MVRPGGNHDDVAPIADIALSVVIAAGCDDGAVRAEADRVHMTGGDRRDVPPIADVTLPEDIIAGGNDRSVGANPDGMHISGRNGLDAAPIADIALSIEVVSRGSDGAVGTETDAVAFPGGDVNDAAPFVHIELSVGIGSGCADRAVGADGVNRPFSGGQRTRCDRRQLPGIRPAVAEFRDGEEQLQRAAGVAGLRHGNRLLIGVLPRFRRPVFCILIGSGAVKKLDGVNQVAGRYGFFRSFIIDAADPRLAFTIAEQTGKRAARRFHIAGFIELHAQRKERLFFPGGTVFVFAKAAELFGSFCALPIPKHPFCAAIGKEIFKNGVVKQPERARQHRHRNQYRQTDPAGFPVFFKFLPFLL